MGASTAYTNLFSGSGMVYVTGPSGVFPAPVGERNYYSYPDLAFVNTPENAVSIKAWAGLNTPENGSGYACFQIEITNAAADNCTGVLVNGVGQTAGAVAMTVGDTTASAASIAAAISAYTPGAGPNYRAINIGPLIIGMSDVIGTGTNGDIVLPSFSGASTATATDVGGGRDSGVGLVRIFIDPSAGASETVMGGAAVEITEWLSYRGLQSGRLIVSASVVASAVQFERSSQDMTVVLSNNATLSDVVSLGAIDGDRITLQGNGADTQVVTASATIGLASGVDYTLTDADTKITLEWDVNGAKWNEVSRASVADATQIRASGVAIPAQPGGFSFQPAGGTASLKPGLTGVSAFPGDIFESTVSLAGAPAILGSSLEFVVVHTGAIVGDSGTVSGNGIAIDLNGNAVNFSSSGGIIASLTPELALSGRWTATWTVVDPTAIAPDNGAFWSISAEFSNENQQIVNTDLIKDAAVTDAKVATGISGTKLAVATVPESALAITTQAKINGLQWSTVNVVDVNHTASDREAVYMDATTVPTTVFLPLAAGLTYMEIFVVKIDAGVNAVTVDGNGANINGVLTFPLAAQYDKVTVAWNGTAWFVKAS